MDEEMLLSSIKDYKKELETLNFICSGASEEYDENKELIEKRIKTIATNIISKTEIFLESRSFKTEEEKELLKKCIISLEDNSEILMKRWLEKKQEEILEESLEENLDKKSSKKLKKEILPKDILKGKLALTAFGIGKLINFVSYLYERYKVPKDDIPSLIAIEEAGLSVMPEYSTSVINDIVETVILYAVPDREMFEKAKQLLDTAKNKADECKEESKISFDNESLKVFLRVAKYAYSGIKKDNKHGIIPLKKRELPEIIARMKSFDEKKGILDIPGGMKVIFGKINNDIVVGFAGTEITNKIGTLGTDIQQLLSPNLTYLRAVGIVNIMKKCPNYKGKRIIVIGHSLGGGLAQTAVLANIDVKENFAEVEGVTFNSAGLSLITLDIASKYNKENIKNASQYILHYRADKDPVSMFGALVGEVISLAGASIPYHCISNLKPLFA